ncbi:MAG: PQQ-binding-like beta-propeller repeat protein, partial [Ardenticatenaceae bacterium]|nr:PQQ-binding-like beta-propeller repeat protein [Ardenticatenaceae bacterium]
MPTTVPERGGKDSMNRGKYKLAIWLILITLFTMLVLKIDDLGYLSVYFADRPKRHAVESMSFTQIWEFEGVKISTISKTDREHPEIFMLTDGNGLVLIKQSLLSGKSSLQKLNLLTGETEWQEKLNESPSAAARNSKYIYVSTIPPEARHSELGGAVEITAYYPSTGQIAWRRKFVGKGITGASQMVADESVISVIGGFGHGEYDNSLYINAINGDEISNQSIADNDSISMRSGQVVHYFQLEELSNSLLLIQPALKKIYAYDPSTNSTLWEMEIPNIVSNIAIDNDTIFFLTDDATLWSVNGETGDTLATLAFKSKYSTPSLSNGYPFQHHIVASDDIVVVYLKDSL